MAMASGMRSKASTNTAAKPNKASVTTQPFARHGAR
jgi:hypothetical protein